MSVKYLVSNDVKERIDFIKRNSDKGRVIAIHNQLPLRGLDGLFDETYQLIDLYKDEVFLRMLARVDRDTVVFFIELGLDYCSFQANYIRPFTKLHPISGQAAATYIIDGFAFYNTEKSIYRPFLYIDSTILGSTVQEFYNAGGYKDYKGNLIENYVDIIRPYIKISTQPVEIKTVKYIPSDTEREGYEDLKQEVIMKKQYPKVKVVRMLLDYINNSKSKLNAILPDKEGWLNVVKNDNRARIQMYKDILTDNPDGVIFYSSGYYGADEIELSRTRDALIRHNKLIGLING